jgi:tetratricopeptide (TPR) repeat protein
VIDAFAIPRRAGLEILAWACLALSCAVAGGPARAAAAGSSAPAVRAAPDSRAAEPYNNLAVLRAAQGQLDEARVALEAALRADPAHREARENLGDLYVRLAVRLWEGLGPAAGRREPDADLARKLRLAREISAPGR